MQGNFQEASSLFVLVLKVFDSSQMDQLLPVCVSESVVKCNSLSNIMGLELLTGVADLLILPSTLRTTSLRVRSI